MTNSNVRLPFPEGEVITLSSPKGTTYRLSILDVIGDGASSVVYEVCDADTGLHYILKECFPAQGAKRGEHGEILWASEDVMHSARERLLRSCETQRILQTSQLSVNTNARLIDDILTGYHTFYTLYPTQNAKAYDRINDTDYTEILKTVRAIALAVSAYHKLGYLHLDIKPQNIMIYPETREMVLLVDSDSCVKQNELSSEIELSYSPGYAAPELIAGRRSRICPASDIYSIGAILFYRLFGRLPEAEDRSTFSSWDLSASSFLSGLTEEEKTCLQALLRKTLSSSPASRYSNVEEFVSDLDALIAKHRPVRKVIVKDRRAYYVVAAVLLLVSLAAAIVGNIQAFRKKWDGVYVISQRLGEPDGADTIETTADDVTITIDAIRHRAAICYPGSEKEIPIEISGDQLTLKAENGDSYTALRGSDGILAISMESMDSPFCLLLTPQAFYNTCYELWDGVYDLQFRVDTENYSWYSGETEGWAFTINVPDRIVLFTGQDVNFYGRITEMDDEQLSFLFYFAPSVANTCYSLGQSGFDLDLLLATDADGSAGEIDLRALKIGNRVAEDPSFSAVWDSMDQMLVDFFLSQL